MYTTRKVETYFDLLSQVAGIPNLLMLLFTLLIRSYADFNSSLQIVQKFMSPNERAQYGSLFSSQWKVTKLYLLDKYPKLFKKFTCCCKQQSKIHTEFSQGNLGDIQSGIKESFDLKRIIKKVHEVYENQLSIMKKLDLGSKKKNSFKSLFSAVKKKRLKKLKGALQDISITK